jgi:3-methyladenine DNA glycosylase AlkC
VANHLNDISKIDEDWVLKKLNEWEKSGKQTPKEMQYIRNHATRTLRKKRTK